MSTLTKFACGHVGRENDAPKAKAKAQEFIGVAEIRNSKVAEDLVKKCPNCG